MGVVWPKVAALLQTLRRDSSPGDTAGTSAAGQRNPHLRATLPRAAPVGPGSQGGVELVFTGNKPEHLN